ncbi:MAG: (Fe-S)-binding protein [Chloroflexota bacterium]|nr:MAG: (Fe-S)-binding protein [Chloroflexota bacterium]
MEASSLSELYGQRKKQVIQDCDLCGICLDVCPSVPLTTLSSMPPAYILEKVINLLKDGTTSEEAYIRAASCMSCGICQDVCPKDINPVIIRALIRLELARLEKKSYSLMEIKVGDSTYFVPDMIASMQVKPEEKRWLTHVPDNPPQKDIVVFRGCGLVMMPDKILLVSEILERLGLDFVIVAGGEYCCGVRYLSMDLDKADAHGKALLHALGSFKPKQVLLSCPECVYQVAQYDKKITPAHFQYESLFHFLSQHVGELGFTQPVNKMVTLHEPCSLSRMLGDTTSLRTILKAIPGLELREMSKNKEQSICCGAVASRKLPVGETMVRQCLEEAAKTGAEVMVDACLGCHFQFLPEEPKYPFQVEYVLTLVGEAMGIVHEDKIRKFYQYGDADKIMAESKENIEAGPYDPEFTALLAKRMFTRSAP